MPPIRVLLFDMDQTLTRDSESTRRSVQQVAPLIQQRCPEMSVEDIYRRFRKVNNVHWDDFDGSPISRMVDAVQARAHIWNEFLQGCGVEDVDLASRIADEFQCARDVTYVAYDDTLPVLRSLYGTLPMYMITNGHSQMQRRKLEVTGLSDWMNGIFVAQEVGFSKPRPEIYEMALQAAEAAPEEALMIGDDPEKDIVGAKRLGIRTAWMLRPDGSPKPWDPQADYTVQNLYQVKEIVERSHAYSSVQR